MKLPSFPCFYDRPKGKYWIKHRGSWLSLDKSDMIERLVEDKYDPKRIPDGHNLSQVKLCLHQIQDEQGIDWAGPLAGWFEGRHEMNGHDVLVTKGPKILKAREGNWDLLRECWNNLLGAGSRQLLTWKAGLKLYRESLLNQKPCQRAAHMFIGESSCGKNTTQEIATAFTGYRSANPWRVFISEEGFNGYLFGAEHLMVADPEISGRAFQSKQDFSNFIKQYLFNDTNTCRAIYREPVQLPVNWFMTFSMNSEKHNIVVPSLDPSFLGKINLYLCGAEDMFPPSLRHLEKNARRALLEKDFAAFAWHLDNEVKVPPELADPRIGIKTWHHPDLLAELSEDQVETRLLYLFEDYPPFNKGPWQGTTTQIIEELEEWKDNTDIREMLKRSGALSYILGRLKARFPERVQVVKRTKKHRGGWLILPAQKPMAELE